ncbi:iron-containing alcohol dehydrogenase [Xanthobacter sp. KR7-225]|uniref:iron-containing alcohol dehydrogenase n=1 Tax=Xanthobacter sp. KR7-225 TaxID=3156613 RepID=UPI0032B4799E
MTSVFFMPTKVVSGAGALRVLGRSAVELGMTRVLVVSDPVISRQAYYADALSLLEASGLNIVRFEDCEVDARVRQIDAQGERVRLEGIDGIISIGGGSVMCAGKGIAIVANNGTSLRACSGVANFKNRPLPMIMVPTTAGSGSEVSQWTVVKDDDHHDKLVCGGPLSFPNVAILDPAVLASLPPSVAAATGVDALTHALEAFTSGAASPITDGLALEAIRQLAGGLRSSVCAVSDEAARTAAIVAASMANMACGNARLGHAHTLSLPLESLLDLPHTLGVGVLMPHVLAFNLTVLPHKAIRVAEALGARLPGDASLAAAIRASVGALRELYADIGFPLSWTESQVPPARLREMAERAVPGLYAGSEGLARLREAAIADGTVIESFAPRRMTVRQAEHMFRACLADPT